MTTIESKKFKPKNTTINAVQFTHGLATYYLNGNRIAITDNDLGNGPIHASMFICDKCGSQTDVHGRLHLDPNDKYVIELVCPGNWLVEDTSGKISTIPDTLFRANFESVKK